MMGYDNKNGYVEVVVSELLPGAFFRFFPEDFRSKHTVVGRSVDGSGAHVVYRTSRGELMEVREQALVWVDAEILSHAIRRLANDRAVVIQRDHTIHRFGVGALEVEVVEWHSGLVNIDVSDYAREVYIDRKLSPPWTADEVIATLMAMVDTVRTIDEPRRDVFAQITELARDHHDRMADKGFWDCTSCDGSGKVDYSVGVFRSERRCQVCSGTGKHRDHVRSLMLIASEAFEAFEGLRKPSNKCDRCKGHGWTVQRDEAGETCVKCDGTGLPLGGSNYAEELADIVIRVLDEAAGRGIDLGAVVRDKMAYNKTRAHKHGKRF